MAVGARRKFKSLEGRLAIVVELVLERLEGEVLLSVVEKRGRSAPRWRLGRLMAHRSLAPDRAQKRL
eukprot:3342739-Alexandrium_andersonii.AAC.1